MLHVRFSTSMPSTIRTAVLLCCACSPAFCADIFITVDELGNGTLIDPAGMSHTMPSTVAADPGPGGQSSALTYDMLNPPDLVFGDVLLGGGAEGLSDIIRFNLTSPLSAGPSLVFYSANTEGFSNLADGAPPGMFYANFVNSPEGMVYTPGPGDPGYVSTSPVHYTFISDEPASAVPEPGTIVLFAGGIALLLISRRDWLRKAL